MPSGSVRTSRLPAPAGPGSRDRWWPRGLAAAAALVVAVGCGAGDPVSPPPAPPNPPPPPPPPAAVASVRIVPDSSIVPAGDTVRFTATVRDAQGNALADRTVTWSSGNVAVATVSGAGLVTAVGRGSVSITATSEGQGGSASVRVFEPDTLPAAAGSGAAAAIPRTPFTLRTEDYRGGAPGLGDLPVSFNTVSVSIDPAATVGELNPLLRELKGEIVGGAPAGGAGAPGWLVLRFPTTTHAELAQRLARLRAHPGVRAASPDVVLASQALPKFGTNVVPGFQAWDRPPDGGNWSQEVTRAPSLWNFNEAVSAAGTRNKVLMIESDVAAAARDLPFVENVTPGARTNADEREHATHVAGIMAAVFGNAEGVNGISPFTDLVGAAITTLVQATDRLEDLIETRNDITVVNLSIGYNWYLMTPVVNPETDSDARDQANDDGLILADRLRSLVASGRKLPVMVASAGNDGRIAPTPDAKWASPFNNAALGQGIAAIIVVEAVGLTPNGAGTVTRADFSEVGGHVSAPGVRILSTVLNSAYDFADGTSMAAPLVAGLVSYLYALDPTLPAPTLTTNPIRKLLIDNAIPAFGGAAPMVDAFASAMALDRLHGNSRVLELLVDVDDGSIDGNLRVDADGNEVTSENLDGGNRPGDGKIDMSDFRRFRDWLIQVEHPGASPLDGRDEHPKKDLNLDGRVESGAAENVYPRGDFNGDGEIHRTKKFRMAGHMHGLDATDLEVLQRLFQDQHYSAAELPDLLDSWDLSIDGKECLLVGDAIQVAVTVTPVGGGAPLTTRTLTSADRLAVITIRTSTPEVIVRAEARDDLGDVVGTSEVRAAGSLGSDERSVPGCADLTITSRNLPNGIISRAYAAALTASGGTGPITWALIGGGLPPGLTLNATTGAIAGTPSTRGTFGFTVRASRDGITAEQALSIRITGVPPTLTGAQGFLPAVVGVPITLQVFAEGGDGSFVFTLASGGIPGVTLRPNGTFAGTPTRAGTYLLTVQVESDGLTGAGSFPVTVLPFDLVIFEGTYNSPGTGAIPVWLLIHPSDHGSVCFLIHTPTRRTTDLKCNDGDIAAYDGQIEEVNVVATSRRPVANKEVTGVVTAADAVLLSRDAFNNHTSFVSTRRVQ